MVQIFRTLLRFLFRKSLILHFFVVKKNYLIQSFSILSCLTSFQVTTDSEAEFFISLHGAGDGELKVYGEAPYGHFPVDLLQSPKEKDTYIVRYTPRGVGEHKIHINFAGEPVKGSPYIVKVRHLR